MEKKIEFDAHIRTGGKSYRDPVGWISVPDLIYVNIPTHFDKFSGESVSVVNFHVTLSPAQDSVEEPDYRAVVTDLLKDTDMKLETIKKEMATMSLPVQREMNTMFIIPLKGQKELIEKLIKEHTPQSD